MEWGLKSSLMRVGQSLHFQNKASSAYQVPRVRPQKMRRAETPTEREIQTWFLEGIDSR